MKKLIVVFSLFLSVGAMAQKADTVKKEVNVIMRGSTYNTLPPLIVLDGVKYTGDLKSIDPNTIESMSVLKSSKETSLYGAEGLNGVILISTKKSKGVNIAPKVTIRAAADSSKTNPLYIIDGKNSTAAGMQGLNPQDIDNVSVLKDASATSIYGPAGKNGVVIIVTKAYKKEHAAKKAETERQGKN